VPDSVRLHCSPEANRTAHAAIEGDRTLAQLAAQNALVAFARDARDAATCSRGRRAPNLWLIAPYILLSYFEIIGIVCPDGATDGAG